MNQLECKALLTNELSKIITDDYILLDLPYFTNVGDVLIWQATLDILKKLPHRCLYSASIETYHKKNIPRDIIILFMGGGNYGDLWERHQLFRYKVLKDYPDNPIVQLPQSVCFQNSEKFMADIGIMDSHMGSIKFCLRDKKSYDTVRLNYHKVEALLLPDMVLSLDISRFCNNRQLKKEKGKGILFVRRQDSERNEPEGLMKKMPREIYESDWPTMVKTPKILQKFNLWIRILRKLHVGKHIICQFTDFYYRYHIKDAYIKSGIEFILPFHAVYSTRLHAAVLAHLLNKKVYMLDNSYGKCSGVYNLWLIDQANIHML